MSIEVLNDESAVKHAMQKEMTINHACTIVAAARSGMKNGVAIRLMSVKRIDKEEFLFMPRKTLFGTSQHRAENPEKWFRYSYNKLRLCNIKVMLPTELSPQADTNDVNSEKYPLVCFYEDKSVSEFVPEWNYDSETDKWSVLYTERPCENPDAAKARYSDNTAQLREILCRMSDISDELGFDEYRLQFQSAVFELDDHCVQRDDDSDSETGRGPSIPSVRRPVLPQQKAKLYSAASRSPSLCGGEWYKTMLAAADSAGKAEELASLAAKLLKQQRLAMLYAVNES